MTDDFEYLKFDYWKLLNIDFNDNSIIKSTLKLLDTKQKIAQAELYCHLLDLYDNMICSVLYNPDIEIIETWYPDGTCVSKPNYGKTVDDWCDIRDEIIKTKNLPLQ